MKKIIFFLMVITVISVNSFSGILGGGSGVSDYWQMKTYFESVAINAQTLKSLNAQLKEIERQIELSKKLPEAYLKRYISQYDDTIKTLVSITNTTKSTLRDAKKAELWFKDVYAEANNRQYMALLDRFTNTLDNLSRDAMKSGSMNEVAMRKTSDNAKILIRKTHEAKNPQQVLEVLSQWSANLSVQMNTIADMISTTNRLDALKAAEEVQARREAQKRSEYTKNSLNNHIKAMENEVKKHKK
ncbi:hypothetical protein [Leptotrichia trevisanii]|uniref:Uncharacterized protein n=1 Tax=Leptotrichia trevisanii TaxID=109328 RepID=A0A510K0J9_9FUSO|nr:hypothetical protein [Leptotrichia trevisanii]BBM44145.1 hypothetical protein JMUB3870_0252 [Leptotrichia trevisanii]